MTDPTEFRREEIARDEIVHDELGAHVSVAGGAANAPMRAARIRSVNFQFFTKQPNRWVEPKVVPEDGVALRAARGEWGTRIVASHDSYLINLASPDPSLWNRSAACFRGEVERCVTLGVDLLVTHPGNATDGDLERGIAKNSEGVARALEAVKGPTRVLLEITAGAGTTVGASFEHLAAIIQGIPTPLRKRVGVCFDTCHAYSAGYDLVNDYDGVWARFDDTIGLDRLGAFHLNDSKYPFESRKDRHEHIGLGSLGDEPFRRLMNDPRFTEVPKLLETPKSEDLVTSDLENLGKLRGFRGG